MSGRWKRLLGIFGSAEARRAGRVLDGFVDSLLQTFENCRPGLPDEALSGPRERVEAFFADLYAKEAGRLGEVVDLCCQHLPPSGRQELRAKTDALIRHVLVPAYGRAAQAFTRRERNDFFLVPEGLKPLERALWAAAGIGLGFFAVWAPFIPIWSKEWVFVFFVGGLVYPNLRRVLALRRYQSDLNGLLARAEDEIWRMDLAYVTMAERPGAESAGESPVAEPPLVRPAEAPPASESRSAPRAAVREGGR
jgi:hypothetical protein